MDLIDDFLDRVPPYRLARNGLAAFALLSIGLAFFGLLPYTALQMIVSLVVLVIAARLGEAMCGLLWRTASNGESAYITALILFFILSPVQSVHEVLLLVAAAAIAILSKYLLATSGKHLFNPAAFAIVATGIFAGPIVTWWVATPVLFLFVLVTGLLVVRKLRRADLFWAFLLSAGAVYVVRILVLDQTFGQSFTQFLLLTPLFFVGTMMLTDPQTSPGRRTERIAYAIIVGFLFPFAFTIGPLSATPASALLVGNLYAYAVSLRRRISLELKEVIPLTRSMYEFVFVPTREFAFAPGQYAEWRQSNPESDATGTRGQLAIASAPEDPFVRIISNRSPGTRVSAAGLSGEPLLPQDPDQKIGIIVSGMGIAPVMSMFRHLSERRERRDMQLIYTARSPLDFAYQEEIESLKGSIGVEVLYLPTDFTELVTWTGKSGFLTSDILEEIVPDFLERQWYLAGPRSLVKEQYRLLRTRGVPKRSIAAEHFSGH